MKGTVDISNISIITKEENMYCVRFPNLPGCITQGETFEQAISNAQEAMAIYYYNEGVILDEKNDIFELQKQHSNAIVQMIMVNTATYKLKIKESTSTAVKKTLTIPEWLDVISRKYPINYSFILKQGIIQYLKNYEGLNDYDRMLLEN